MSSFILLPLSNGQVSASLTGIEFTVGLFVVWGIEVLIAGVWVLRLHHKNKIELKSHRSFPRNQLTHKRLILLLTLLMSGLLAALVAILESNLTNKNGISTKSVNTTRWVRMNESADSSPSLMDSPPQNFKLDLKAIEISELLDCEHGLDILPFESSSDVKRSLTLNEAAGALVPKCRTEPDSLVQNTTSIENDFSKDLSKYYSSRQYLQFSRHKSFIFPYKPIDLTTILNEGKNISVARNCGDKNISTISTAPIPFGVAFDIGGMDEFGTSQMILSRICEKHEGRNITFKKWAFENEFCILDYIGSGPQIEHECVLKYYEKLKLDTFNVTLDGMSVLFTYDRIQNEVFKTAVLCSNATIHYEYVLVPSALVDRSRPNSAKNTIVSIRWRVLNGRCESTYYPVGLSALIYSTFAEWDPNNLGEMKNISRHQRYYAYIESLARFNFPYNSKIGRLGVRETRAFQTTETKTLVKLDLTSYPLIVATIISFVIIAISLVCRLLIPSDAWKASFIKNAIITINQDLHPTGNISIGNNVLSSQESITLKSVKVDPLRDQTKITFTVNDSKPENNSTRRKSYQMDIE